MPNLTLVQPLLYDGTMFARPCDGERNVESAPVAVPVGANAALALTLRQAATFAPVYPATLAGCVAFRFSLWEPQRRTLVYATSDVAADAESKSVAVDMAGSWTEPMRDALGDAASRVFAGELAGFAAEGDAAPSFVLSFPVRIGNRRDTGADTSPMPGWEESDPVALAALDAVRNDICDALDEIMGDATVDAESGTLYARNPATGLYHRIIADADGEGNVSLAVEQEGEER